MPARSSVAGRTAHPTPMPHNLSTEKADLSTTNLTIIQLLHTEKSIEAAAEIWGGFEKARFEFEIVREEEEEQVEADDEWGYGEMEEVEAEGWRINGEFEPSIGGYGE